jgi:tetratricopeptide (TPR) repeat protein
MSSSSVGARWAPPLVRSIGPLLPLAVFVLLATFARPAVAQSSPLQQQADALFAEGRDLLEKGKFPEACAKLARSAELSPAVGTLTNLGYCNEQIGRFRSAMNAYAEAETLAAAVNDSKRAAFAREHFVALEPRVPKLVLRLVAPEAPGLTLKRNGAPMLKTDLDRPIAVDPQDYGFEASAPGFATWKTTVVVRGDGAVVTVMVPPLEREAARVEAPHAATFGMRRVAAVGLGALSLFALGGGLTVALAAKSRYDDASSHCDASGCDATGASIQSGAAAQGNVATALVGLGLLSGGAAVYLWMTGAPERGPKAARAVRLDVTPRGAALGGHF